MDLTYRPASPERLPRLLELMEAEEYLGPTLERLGMTKEQFRQLLYQVGAVYSVYAADEAVGYLWVEQRERVLHLHGLVIEPDHQGKGIGPQIMKLLETTYATEADSIELGVHESNRRALEIYERSGFNLLRTMPSVGFLIMQKPLQNR